MDIEGEELRQHISDLAWASSERGAAVSSADLVAGSRDRSVGPVTFTVPSGAIAMASGDPVDRRLLAATLAGRLDAVGGRAQVLGHPLPSDSATVASLVALADVGGVERAETSVTVGELLRERLELRQPWYRMWLTARQSRTWLERANAVLGGSTLVRASSTLIELPHLERSVTLAMIALAERAPVVMLDQLDSFASTDDEKAFVEAVHALAPTATVIIGTPIPVRAIEPPQLGDRALVLIDLYSLTPVGAPEGTS